MVLQIQAAIRAARPAGCADHQAQHAVAPAADPVVVGLGVQVIDLVNTLGVDPGQRRLLIVAAGVQERQARTAGFGAGRLPAEVLAEVLLQRRAPAGVVGVEQEVLEIDREEFARVVQLVAVRAALVLAVIVDRRAASADALGPAGQFQQARIVGQGEAPRGLATTVVRQANRAQRTRQSGAARQLATIQGGPEAGTVIQVRQLVQHGGQQFAVLRAMGAPGRLAARAAIGQPRQQGAIEQQSFAGHAPVHGLGQFGPAHGDATVQAFDQARWQCRDGFVEQLATGQALGIVQPLFVHLQTQFGARAGGQRQEQEKAEEAKREGMGHAGWTAAR